MGGAGDSTSPQSDPIHASCVALSGQGALILGASGSGKSALALQLMAYGAVLVADDRVILRREGERLIASAPPQIAGLIEARGIGLLHAMAAGPTALALAVDLDHAAASRMPAPQSHGLLGVDLPLIAGRDMPHLAAAIMQYLRSGPATQR